ncbi:E3 ubiquitin-protein ligase RNF181-like [Pistacia vera]|uniref:E3 ubiquitin-protein ligase RNF181-like n=1 Tax=Pistacia vera TaxID=55513 RepID=UPI00126343A1|nr:E3 ubiquitin-protein ligase RNF181-like [Pistacia vera]
MALQEPEVIESEISQVLSIAREMARNNGCEILTIRIELHLYSITDSEILEESIQDVPRPIPTSKEVIQKLEKVSFQTCPDSIRECTICYEKFHQNGHLYQIVRLPCGHFYHKDCILNWLEISHMCPLFRYQLPCYEN